MPHKITSPIPPGSDLPISWIWNINRILNKLSIYLGPGPLEKDQLLKDQLGKQLGRSHDWCCLFRAMAPAPDVLGPGVGGRTIKLGGAH